MPSRGVSPRWVLNSKRLVGDDKLNLLQKHAWQSESNIKLCFEGWLEGEFLLLSRDLIKAKKESLQGMQETCSILLSGMSNSLMALRLASTKAVSNCCLDRMPHPKRHNRSSILTVIDIANRTPMSCQESLAIATTACAYQGLLQLQRWPSSGSNRSRRMPHLNRHWIFGLFYSFEYFNQLITHPMNLLPAPALIPTSTPLADLFTKPISRHQFDTLIGDATTVGWRDLLVVQKISLIEIISTCSAATSYGCRSFGVFYAIDSATLQPVHRCTPAPYGILAVPAVLLTHSFGDMDHWWFKSSHSMLDVDWCYNDSLIAPLFARLRQLHSFKQRLLSHLEHCPNSMDFVTNTPTPSRDSCHCCWLTTS